MTDLRGELAGCFSTGDTPARARLLALVRRLDLALDGVLRRPFAERASREDADAATEALVREVLARAAVALAPLVGDASAATADAARAYLAAPSDGTWDAFETASTGSYPFGPGDGCLAVAELGGHGTPGAGDHGAGFVWCVAETAGVERAYEALHASLGAWLLSSPR